MRLSIIIVNYKSPDALLTCLHSIREAPPEGRFEVLVVDNASGDESVKCARERFADALVIENRRNVGFAGAVNQAFRQAGGEYVLILNPDIVVSPGAIDRMIGYLEEHSEVGLVLPKLLNPDGSLQFSCRTFYSLPILLLRRTPLSRIRWGRALVDGHLMTSWDHNDTREVDWGLGACMMVRRSLRTDGALMDERFFLYFEDVDLCYRLRMSGWKVVYVPEAVMVHAHGRASARRVFSRAWREHFLSLVRFFVKHRSLRRSPWVDSRVD